MNEHKGQLNYYSEWLNLFIHIKKEHSLRHNHKLLLSGSLKDKKFSYEGFCNSLIEFVEYYLNFIIQRFNHNLNFYLKNNQQNSVKYSINHFFAQLKMIKFYESLKFMDNDTKQNITKEIDRNVDEYVNQLKNHFYSLSPNSLFYSEIYYLILKNRREL